MDLLHLKTMNYIPQEENLGNSETLYTVWILIILDTEFSKCKNKMSINMISKMGINANLGDAYLVGRTPIAGPNRQYYVFLL